MLDRFSEPARRAAFWAYHEANEVRCPQVMTEHLLLGIFREDRQVAGRFGADAADDIRRDLEGVEPPNRENITKPVDLPLSPDAQQVLMLTIKEADAAGQKAIDTPQFLLALLRNEDCAGVVSARP